MKKTALTVAFALTLLFTMAFPLSALADPPPISESDFTFKVGKASIDLLKMNMTDIAKKTRRSIVRKKPIHEDDYLTRVIKTSTTYFYGSEYMGTYCFIVDFTKKGVTSRGIRIGSPEKSVIEAYPIAEKYEADAFDDHRYYACYAQAPNDELSEYDEAHMNEFRPLYYYALWFKVSSKTQKVVAISIGQRWIEDP